MHSKHSRSESTGVEILAENHWFDVYHANCSERGNALFGPDLNRSRMRPLFPTEGREFDHVGKLFAWECTACSQKCFAGVDDRGRTITREYDQNNGAATTKDVSRLGKEAPHGSGAAKDGGF